VTAGHRAQQAISADSAHYGFGPHAPHAHDSQICTAFVSIGAKPTSADRRRDCE
jgi:hypothetical protein